MSEPQSLTRNERNVQNAFIVYVNAQEKNFTGTLLSAKKRRDLRSGARKDVLARTCSQVRARKCVLANYFQESLISSESH